jgi:hypothetical protein
LSADRARSLPPNWWRDRDLFLTQAHHSNAELHRLYGRSEALFRKWRRIHQLEPSKDLGAAAPRRLVLLQGGAQPEVSEEEMLRQRNDELERALSQGRERNVFEERLIRSIQQSCQSKVPTFKPPKRPSRTLSSKPHEFVLLWSDTHAAEVVSREETNGINSYDWQTMMRRQQRMYEAVLVVSRRTGRTRSTGCTSSRSATCSPATSTTSSPRPTSSRSPKQPCRPASTSRSGWSQFVPHFREIQVRRRRRQPSAGAPQAAGEAEVRQRRLDDVPDHAAAARVRWTVDQVGDPEGAEVAGRRAATTSSCFGTATVFARRCPACRGAA